MYLYQTGEGIPLDIADFVRHEAKFGPLTESDISEITKLIAKYVRHRSAGEAVPTAERQVMPTESTERFNNADTGPLTRQPCEAGAVPPENPAEVPQAQVGGPESVEQLKKAYQLACQFIANEHRDSDNDDPFKSAAANQSLFLVHAGLKRQTAKLPTQHLYDDCGTVYCPACRERDLGPKAEVGGPESGLREWIPISERLPENCADGQTPKRYIVWDSHWQTWYDAYYLNDGDWQPGPEREPPVQITAWMNIVAYQAGASRTKGEHK